jgi:antitoxin ParD1/3/4
LVSRRYDPMATLSFTLPDDMKTFVEEQANRRGFGTVSEFLTAMIAEVQQHQTERQRLDAALLEGLASGPATPLTNEDWEDIRGEGKKLIAERKLRRQ